MAITVQRESDNKNQYLLHQLLLIRMAINLLPDQKNHLLLLILIMFGYMRPEPTMHIF